MDGTGGIGCGEDMGNMKGNIAVNLVDLVYKMQQMLQMSIAVRTVNAGDSSDTDLQQLLRTLVVHTSVQQMLRTLDC
jgi:hypothetical protein